MFKVQVENFQSIKKAQIDVDGFTVVTGPNNSGKSALMRAIRGVFTNPPSSSFLRHGAKHLAVKLEFEDGQTIEWVKGNRGTNKYIINGHDLENVGRGAPSEALDLGIFPIQVGGNQIWPQMAPQITGQVFLLDEVGSVVAEAIADVDRVGVLNSALKDSESDRRAANSRLKVRRTDEAKQKEELEMFSNLGEAEEIVAALAEQRKKAKKAFAAIQTLRRLQGEIKECQEQIDALAPVKQVSVLGEDKIDRIKEEARNIRSLEKLRDEYEEATREESTLRAAVEAVTPFLGLEQYDQSMDKFRRAVDALRGLRERMNDARDSVQQQGESLEEKKIELDGINEEIAEIAGHLSECPVCGSVLNSEQSEGV